MLQISGSHWLHIRNNCEVNNLVFVKVCKTIEHLYRRGRRQLQMLRSGHATAMGAFVRTRAPTEESTGAGAPGTLSDEGDDPKRPLDRVRTPKTPLDGR